MKTRVENMTKFIRQLFVCVEQDNTAIRHNLQIISDLEAIFCNLFILNSYK
jgi:hypothetical protein